MHVNTGWREEQEVAMTDRLPVSLRKMWKVASTPPKEVAPVRQAMAALVYFIEDSATKEK